MDTDRHILPDGVWTSDSTTHIGFASSTGCNG